MGEGGTRGGCALGQRERKALLLMPDCSHRRGCSHPLFSNLSLSLASNECEGGKVQRPGLDEDL